MSDFHPSYYQMLGVGPVPYKEGVLLQFKAGKMSLVSKKLKSDPRRGVVRVSRDGDDLIHVQWIERDSAMQLKDTAEDDVVIFPGEATFKKTLPQMSGQSAEECARKRRTVGWFNNSTGVCPTIPRRRIKGHVFLESVIDTDAELSRQMNTVLHPPDRVPSMGDGATAATSEEQVASGSEAAKHPSAEQLAQMLSAISSEQDNSGPQAQAALAASLLASACGVPLQSRRAVVGPSLGEILKPDILSSFLADPDMLQRLSPHLPEEHRNQAALQELAQSPQFQQQLKTFSMALQTGQLDLATLEINAQGYSVVDFLKGVQDLVEKEQNEKKSDSEEECSGGKDTG